MKTVAYPHPVAPGQAGFARQEYMALSRIFYDYSNILYGSRARAGLLIPGPDLVNIAAPIDMRNLLISS